MSKVMTAVLEDYLETILLLNIEGKVARLKDIADSMAVKAPSALEALAMLEQGELVRHEHYGGFELTPKGRRRARRIYSKHTGVRDFLTTVLGIDAKTADHDACQVEHCLSPQTVDRMAEFMRFIRGCEQGEPVCLRGFHSPQRPCSCPVKTNIKRKKE